MTEPDARPPYRVPTMEEIRAQPPNGLRVASLFAGGGGSSTGYRMAGYRVVFASEFIPAAAETYEANAAPYTVLDRGDVRELTGERLLKAAELGVGELDVLDGSPPCASFSTSGKREAGWGKVKAYSDSAQRTDDLFYEYARLVGEVQPKVFVAENVSGLVKGTAKGYFIEILTALRAQGYRVEARLLDAQWLGVPQARQRLIFVGVREDLDRDPVFPTPLPYRYALADVLTSDEVLVDPETGKDISISRYAIGREWERIGEGGTDSRYLNLSRPARTSPVGTITAMGGGIGAAAVTHPTEPRKFTLGELRALGGFPPDYVLTGTYEQRWERIGRAVPPLMMKAVAETIAREILQP